MFKLNKNFSEKVYLSDNDILNLFSMPNTLTCTVQSTFRTKGLNFAVGNINFSATDFLGLTERILRLPQPRFLKPLLFLFNKLALSYEKAKDDEMKMFLGENIKGILKTIATQYKEINTFIQTISEENREKFKFDMTLYKIEDLLIESIYENIPYIHFLTTYDHRLLQNNFRSQYDLVFNEEFLKKKLESSLFSEIIDTFLKIKNNNNLKNRFIKEITSFTPSHIKQHISNEQFESFLRCVLNNEEPVIADNNKHLWLSELFNHFHKEESKENIVKLGSWIDKIDISWRTVNNINPKFISEYLSLSIRYYTKDVSIVINRICEKNRDLVVKVIFETKNERQCEQVIIENLHTTKAHIENSSVDNVISDVLLEERKLNDTYHLTFQHLSWLSFLDEWTLSFLKANDNYKIILQQFLKNNFKYRNSYLDIDSIHNMLNQVFEELDNSYLEDPELRLTIYYFIINNPKVISEKSYSKLNIILDIKNITSTDFSQLIEIAIKNSLLTLLKNILFHDNDSKKEFLEDTCLNILKGNVSASPRVIGLLFAHQHQQLQKSNEFDFLLTAYADYCHQLWKKSLSTGVIYVSFSHSHAENSMHVDGGEKILGLAKKRFPDISPKKYYDECIQYVCEELQKLEKHDLARKQLSMRSTFIPEENVKGVIVSRKEMNNEEKQIAIFHTALRFLMKDPLAYSVEDPNHRSYDPYFKNFNAVIGYSFAIAKEADNRESFIYDLAYCRREHNTDEGRNRFYLTDDFSSCPAGVKGRLYQHYILSNNILAEKERKPMDIIIQDFNPIIFHGKIKDFLFKCLRGLSRSFHDNNHHHLVWLIYAYQRAIDFCAGIDDEEDLNFVRENAIKSLSHILDNEINYALLFKSLVSDYTPYFDLFFKNEMQESLKFIIKQKIIELFEIETASQTASAHLEAWEGLQDIVLTELYPDLLLHFLSDTMDKNNEQDPRELNFKQLVSVAVQMPTSVLERFQNNLISSLPILAKQCLGDFSDLEISSLLDKINILKDENIITNEKIDLFLRTFFYLAAEVEDYPNIIIKFIEIVLLKLDCDFHNAILEVFKMILTKNHYENHSKLRKLFNYFFEKEFLTLETITPIVEEKVNNLLKTNRYKEYGILVKFFASIGIVINLYTEKEAAQTREVIINISKMFNGTMLGFKKITPQLKNYFLTLKERSLNGDAYASFALGKLYSSKQGISDNSEWVKDTALSHTYMTIALQQAQELKIHSLISEINGYVKDKNLFIEDLYYKKMLAILIDNNKSGETLEKRIQDFLLIARSIDLGRVLHGSLYQSAEKLEIQTILISCRNGNNETNLVAILEIYKRLLNYKCFIQTEEGGISGDDPRVVVPELEFKLRFIKFERAVILFSEDKKHSNHSLNFEVENFCEEISILLDINPIQLVEWLQTIYFYMTRDNQYEGNIYTLSISPAEVITHILNVIFEKSNVSIRVTQENTDLKKISNAKETLTIPLNDPKLLYNAIKKSRQVINNKAAASVRDILFVLENDYGMTSDEISILIKTTLENIEEGSQSSHSYMGFYISLQGTNEKFLQRIIRSEGMTVCEHDIFHPSKETLPTETHSYHKPLFSSFKGFKNQTSSTRIPYGFRSPEMFEFLDTPLFFSKEIYKNNHRFVEKHLGMKNIIFAGSRFVGTTELFRQVIGDKSSCAHDFKYKDVTLHNSHVKLKIWDWRGFQSIGWNECKLFCGDVNLIVFCFDLTDWASFEMVERYIKKINHHYPMSIPLLIVGNKCDLENGRIVPTDIGKTLTNKYNSAEHRKIRYIETSALTGTNIERAIETIAYCSIENAASPAPQRSESLTSFLTAGVNTVRNIISYPQPPEPVQQQRTARREFGNRG